MGGKGGAVVSRGGPRDRCCRVAAALVTIRGVHLYRPRVNLRVGAPQTTRAKGEVQTSDDNDGDDVRWSILYRNRTLLGPDDYHHDDHMTACSTWGESEGLVLMMTATVMIATMAICDREHALRGGGSYFLTRGK